MFYPANIAHLVFMALAILATVVGLVAHVYSVRLHRKVRRHNAKVLEGVARLYGVTWRDGETGARFRARMVTALSDGDTPPSIRSRPTENSPEIQ